MMLYDFFTVFIVTAVIVRDTTSSYLLLPPQLKKQESESQLHITSQNINPILQWAGYGMWFSRHHCPSAVSSANTGADWVWLPKWIWHIQWWGWWMELCDVISLNRASYKIINGNLKRKEQNNTTRCLYSRKNNGLWFIETQSFGANDSLIICSPTEHSDSFKVQKITMRPREGKPNTSFFSLLWLYPGYTVHCPQCRVYYH